MQVKYLPLLIGRRHNTRCHPQASIHFEPCIVYYLVAPSTPLPTAQFHKKKKTWAKRKAHMSHKLWYPRHIQSNSASHNLTGCSFLSNLKSFFFHFRVHVWQVSNGSKEAGGVVLRFRIVTMVKILRHTALPYTSYLILEYYVILHCHTPRI